MDDSKFVFVAILLVIGTCSIFVCPPLGFACGLISYFISDSEEKKKK